MDPIERATEVTLLYVHHKEMADVPPTLWNLGVRYAATHGYRVVEVPSVEKYFGPPLGTNPVPCVAAVHRDEKIIALAKMGRGAMALSLIHELAHTFEDRHRDTHSMLDQMFSGGALTEIKVEGLTREVVRYLGGNADQSCNDYIEFFAAEWCVRRDIAEQWVDAHLQDFLAELFDASASGSAPCPHVVYTT